MANPQFIEEEPVTLAEVRNSLKVIEKRDEEMNYRSNRVKDFLDSFNGLDIKKKDELWNKINDLNLTRIKEEHLVKIVDFLPKDVEELKIVLQAYPLSLPKKDQDAIINVVKEFI